MTGGMAFRMRLLQLNQPELSDELNTKKLAGAGGFEPPYGGIKICRTTLIGRGFSPDWDEKRPCCINTLATISRPPKVECLGAAKHLDSSVRLTRPANTSSCFMQSSWA
jgi:hypothetical protein